MYLVWERVPLLDQIWLFEKSQDRNSEMVLFYIKGMYAPFILHSLSAKY